MALPAQAQQMNPVATSPVVLVDVDGNAVSTSDNGDGTATLVAAGTNGTPVNLTGASQVVSAVPTTLNLITVAETTGTGVAKVRFWDSATATSVGKACLGVYTLSSGESREEANRKTALLGVWCELVSGSFEGAAFIGS